MGAFFSTLDARITPVTAYQFIRNCGSKMSAEAAESRISLVMEIWEKLKEKGTYLLSPFGLMSL